MPQTYRFDEFELEPAERRLRTQGRTVRLERRPMDLLVLLVQRNGHLVTRDEIVAALWPDRVIIDFESGLVITSYSIHYTKLYDRNSTWK